MTLLEKKSLIYSALYFLSLEIIIRDFSWFIWVFLGLVVILSFQKLWPYLLSVLMALAGLLLAASLVPGRVTDIIVLIMSIIFYQAIQRDDFPFYSIFSMFAYSAGLYALYLNYLSIDFPVVALLILVFSTGLFGWALFFRQLKSWWVTVPESLINERGDLMKLEVTHEATVMALLIFEVMWIMTLLPFGYLTTGAVLAIIYGLLYTIFKSWLDNSLTSKLVKKTIFWCLVALAAILFSTPWLPK